LTLLHCWIGWDSGIIIALQQAISLISVYFYNFGWKDYGEATLSSLLDMVKVMAFALTEGKVAIHCHAGNSTKKDPLLF
jgi:protein-tyrosine phosphatase